MQAIITKQNADGSYSEAGMNTRCLISYLKSERGVLKWAAGYAGGKPHRIQLFSNIYADPIKTIYRG